MIKLVSALRRTFIATLLLPILGLKARALRTIDGSAEVTPLTADLREHLAKNAATGSQLLNRYTGQRDQYRAVDIDQAIDRWRTTPEAERESPEVVIESLGFVFGNLLVAKLGLEWQVYRDKSGVDLCVIHPQVFVVSFPHSAIYKAVAERRQGALESVQKALSEQVASSLADPNARRRE